MRKRTFIFLLLSLLVSQIPTFGQDGDLSQFAIRERYPDIDLYYRWQENEERDSIYFKAYQKYLAELANEERTKGKDCRNTAKSVAVQELEAFSAAFSVVFWREKDYDRAFYISFRLEEKLPLVTEGQYPHKRETYYSLGEAYYLSLDFHKSIALLEKALAPTPLAFDDRANLDALKILGICYANIGQMDISEDYFRATLLSDDIVMGRPLYNAYALSHLGCNAMLAGQYEKAIALSETVWPVLRQETEDYGHLAGMCYCRGRSYLEKGDFKQAAAWIDSLVYFAGRDKYNQTKRVKQAHRLRADYHTAMGDAKQAKVYNDSLVNVYRQSEKQYTSQYIARGYERFNNEKIADREAALKTSQICLALITVVALSAIAATAVILLLYRQKGAAYKALAQRAKEWARQETPCGISAKTVACGDEPGDEDYRIIALADREMTERYIYREVGLSIDALADRLDVHRNTLSAVINRCTGGNFNRYVNTYRVSEAVRIISQTNRKELYIDELYERVGFNTRSSFYRAFKQFTGLSPIEFQKNKDLTKSA